MTARGFAIVAAAGSATLCFYEHHLIPARELKGLLVKNGRVYAPYRYHRT